MSSTTLASLALDFAADHPEDAAAVLARLAAQDASALLESCPNDVAARIARHLTAQELAAILECLSSDRVADLLPRLPRGRVASSLRRLGSDERRRITDLLPPATKRALATLLTFEEETAGAWMEPQVLTVSKEADVAAARETIARNSDRLRYYLYVVDGEERLVGVVDLRTLMSVSGDSKVESLMRREVHRISARAKRDAILRHPGWEEVHALPVVDEENLVGVLRYETVKQLSRGERKRDSGVAARLALVELYWSGSRLVFDELFDLISKEDAHVTSS